ncbi:MBL fold metallo-hydrolase [Streptomyces spiroverticillatus]|uniref:MBL fold metallo-hydrolase n=1 Tax=Streptomyces finlayi TaxID=67296 RepID=A0A919CDQ2_9ACTN|nr:MBL fold metallo-hydrolase [Streptomyces finlayi]GHA35860.1 MBL fold metallo-hydrolase [Streptomyces spiroverticillatus]GHD12567.1 MBL fold metallo-hydrolase [Streptomyces finlayi]
MPHPAPAVVPAPVTDRTTEVADGVHAFVQPPGGWCLNNAGVIVSEGRSALVDTVATESRARALRRAALRLTPAAPQAVVNTHFHGDHAFGNHLFPEALVVGHERTRTEMIASGLHLTGLWPDVDWGTLTLVPPALTFRDALTLHVGSVRAEVVHVGPRAHTSNDSVVWLPEQKVLFTGDLVMSGVTPFFLMGSLAGSLAALERLRAFGATTVVPGHGPVCGPEVFDTVEGYLRRVAELAAQGRAAGLTPVETAREADLGPYADLLDSERLVPNLHRAFAELAGTEAAEALPMPVMEKALGEMIAYHGRPPHCLA